MFEKILIPLDGSVNAEMVIPYVEEIASTFGSQIIIVSVSDSLSSDTRRLHRAYLDVTTEKVQHNLDIMENQKAVPVQSHVLIGKPAIEILKCAAENDVGLIAMTSRGSSLNGPWLLGDIAAKVLRATTKPSLLVRTPASKAAIQHKKLLKRILVPLDGSELGAAAIPYAKKLGTIENAKLFLYQVLEQIDLSWLNQPQTFYSMPEDQKSRKEHALDYLNGIGKRLEDSGIQTSSAVDWGSPSDQIIDYAKTNSIDLIALSTHGRSGIRRWVFGSVTDKILHAGDTAVLVVREPGLFPE
jgi:nucleotide-binding universal stress UspA family protein